MNRRWSDKEDGIIIAFHKRLSRKQLAKKLGVSYHSLHGRITKLIHQRRLTLKGKKIDNNKLTDMWFKHYSCEEIARNFDCSVTGVQQARKRLGLPNRWKSYCNLKNEKLVIEKLEGREGNYYEYKDLSKSHLYRAVKHLLTKRQIHKVCFMLKTGKNIGRRGAAYPEEIFNKEFLHKSFICLNRTSLIRLVSKSCKKPDTREKFHILTNFLRKFLTEAERCAVLWKLGVRRWDSAMVKKGSIQVDGVVYSRRKQTKN